VPRADSVSAFTVAKNALREFSEDDCTTLAASIAYAAFFSIFPLLLGATAVLGYVIEDPAARDKVLNSVYSYLPASGEFIGKTLQEVMEKRGAVGVVAALLLIFSGRQVFASVVHALNRAFEAPKERGFIQTLILVFILIFGVGALMVLSLAVTAVIQALASYAILGFGPYEDTIILTPIQIVLSLIVSFAMFALMYRAAPNVQLGWRDVAPGAMVAAVLFEIAKNLFVVYVKNFMGTENVYGAVGGVIVLLTWCYFSALILSIGAEVASEHMKLKLAENKALRTPRPAPAIQVPHPTPPVQRAAAVGSALVASGLAVAAVLRTRGRGGASLA
jgi:membrane protein